MVDDPKDMVVTKTRPMGVSASPEDRAHERSDVDFRVILISIGSIFLIVVFTVVAMWGLFQYYDVKAEKRAIALSPLADTVAMTWWLQLSPRADMNAMRAHTDSLLGSSGIIDRGEGSAHIPIDRAIELLQQRGIQRPAPAPKQDSPKRDSLQPKPALRTR